MKPPIRQSSNPQDLAIAVRQSIEDLAARGLVDELDKALATLQDNLHLAPNALDQLRKEAKRIEAEVRDSRGAELKRAAEQAKCAFEYKPPLVTFGCVRLRQIKQAQWSLHILDATEILVVRSDRATDLADAALQKIEEISKALDDFETFAAALRATHDFFVSTQGRCENICPTLLMLACSGGRRVPRFLAALGDLQPTRLTRYQMGYLLARAKIRHDQKDPRMPLITMRGATQQVTRDPSRYIPIPHTDDPRQLADAKPVASLTIQYAA